MYHSVCYLLCKKSLNMTFLYVSFRWPDPLLVTFVCVFRFIFMKLKVSQFIGFFWTLLFRQPKGIRHLFTKKTTKPPMYLTIRIETSYSLHLHSLAKVWLSHNRYKSRGYLDRCFLLCYIWSKLGIISLRFIFFLYFCFIWLLNLKNLLKNSTEIIWIH